jgi:uncharacterized protein (TIGR03066 family)
LLKSASLVWLLAVVLICTACSKSPPTEAELKQQIADAEAKLAELKTGKLSANDKKLIGTWKLTKGDAGKVKSLTITFDLQRGFKVVGEDFEDFTLEGTFATEGDSLVVKFKSNREEWADHSFIQKLTTKELVLKNEAGETEEYQKQ